MGEGIQLSLNSDADLVPLMVEDITSIWHQNGINGEGWVTSINASYKGNLSQYPDEIDNNVFQVVFDTKGDMYLIIKIKEAISIGIQQDMTDRSFFRGVIPGSNWISYIPEYTTSNEGAVMKANSSLIFRVFSEEKNNMSSISIDGENLKFTFRENLSIPFPGPGHDISVSFTEPYSLNATDVVAILKNEGLRGWYNNLIGNLRQNMSNSSEALTALNEFDTAVLKKLLSSQTHWNGLKGENEYGNDKIHKLDTDGLNESQLKDVMTILQTTGVNLTKEWVNEQYGGTIPTELTNLWKSIFLAMKGNSLYERAHDTIIKDLLGEGPLYWNNDLVIDSLNTSIDKRQRNKAYEDLSTNKDLKEFGLSLKALQLLASFYSSGDKVDYEDISELLGLGIAEEDIAKFTEDYIGGKVYMTKENCPEVTQAFATYIYDTYSEEVANSLKIDVVTVAGYIESAANAVLSEKAGWKVILEGIPEEVNFSMNQGHEITIRNLHTEMANYIPSSEGQAFAKTSITFRAKYYYYYTQYRSSSIVFPVGNIINKLTDNLMTSSGWYSSAFVGELANKEAHTYLLKIINELHYYGSEYYTAFNWLANLSETEKQEHITNIKAGNVQQFVGYKEFMEMKNAITFLEIEAKNSYPKTSDGFSEVKYFQDIIQEIWYDKRATTIDAEGNETSSVSLEELYQAIASLGLDLTIVDDYVEGHSSEPLRSFFWFNEKDHNDWGLNTNLLLGMSQSASYIPLKTNVYDPYTYLNINHEPFFDFHEMYGYHRKALKIDTNAQSAVELARTGRRGATRVATLYDILNAEGDVVLYTDTNFYNVNKLADILGMAYDKLDNESGNEDDSGNPFTALWRRIQDFFSITIEEITKTGNKDKYSRTLQSVHSYDETNKKDYSPDAKNSVILMGRDIDTYLRESSTATDYNVMRSFAFVSSVYRDKKLYNLISSGVAVEPVFIASEEVCNMPSMVSTDRSSILNYALMKNLNSQKTMSYETTIDLYNPIYIDVYGNIITESGAIIIPFSANATINTDFNPFSAAWLYTYGKDYYIPANKKLPDMTLSHFFKKDVINDRWIMNNLEDNQYIDVAKISIANQEALNELINVYMSQQFSNKGKSRINFHKYVKGVFMEVMRGAPLDNIDKEFEALNVNRRLTVSGIKAAVKAGEFMGTISGFMPNNLMALPRLEHMDGIEYIIMIVYKAVLLSFVVIIIMQIFAMALKGRNLGQVLKNILLSMLTVVILLYTLPKSFELSYYSVNKALLQDEMMSLVAYNIEKRAQGVELGMIEAKTPTQSSKIMMRIKDIDVPWYEMIKQIVLETNLTTMTSIYEKYARMDEATSRSEFTLKGNSIYMDVYDLVEATRIDIRTETHRLVHVADNDIPASFYTPYYYFLTKLTDNINKYNRATKIYSYTTNVYKGGRLVSLGVVEPYFTQKDFLEYDPHSNRKIGDDVLGLWNEVYFNYDALTGKNVSPLVEAQWFNETLDENQIERRISILETYFIDLIKERRDLIGKISDESFIKIIALELAVEYNKVFSINYMQDIELFDLSMEDMVRIGAVTERVAMEGAPYDFFRFIYSVSGEFGVYMATFLLLILSIMNFLKPLAVILIFILIFASLLVNRLILNRDDNAIGGYLILTLLVCLGNLLYAVLLKGTFLLANQIPSATVNMLIIAILNLACVAYYAWVLSIALRNWRDMGGSTFMQMAFDAKDKISSMRFGVNPSKVKELEEGESLMDRMAREDAIRSQPENRSGDNTKF